MLMIRLQRVGRANDPSFRVIVTEHTNKPRTGNVLELLGSYDARKGEPQLNVPRIKYWLSVGAKASVTVHNLLVRAKIVEAKKVNALPSQKPAKKEETGNNGSEEEKVPEKEKKEETKQEKLSAEAPKAPEPSPTETHAQP